MKINFLKIVANIALSVVISFSIVKVVVPINVNVEIQNLRAEMKSLKARLIEVESLTANRVSARQIDLPGWRITTE